MSDLALLVWLWRLLVSCKAQPRKANRTAFTRVSTCLGGSSSFIKVRVQVNVRPRYRSARIECETACSQSSTNYKTYCSNFDLHQLALSASRSLRTKRLGIT